MAATLTPVNPSLGFAQDRLAAADFGRHVTQMAAKDKEREERLAAALRENLRRRKTQTREAVKPEDDQAER